MDEPTVRGAPDLMALLLTTRSLDEFLTALARTASAAVPDGEGCGITLARESAR